MTSNERIFYDRVAARAIIETRYPLALFAVCSLCGKRTDSLSLHRMDPAPKHNKGCPLEMQPVETAGDDPDTVRVVGELGKSVAARNAEILRLRSAYEAALNELEATGLELIEARERSADIFDQYPVGTIFQRKSDGRILAMTPDDGTTHVARAPVEPAPPLCPNGHPARPLDLDVAHCAKCNWTGPYCIEEPQARNGAICPDGLGECDRHCKVNCARVIERDAMKAVEKRARSNFNATHGINESAWDRFPENNKRHWRDTARRQLDAENPSGPESLVGALQDRVHKEIGVTRAAHAVKAIEHPLVGKTLKTVDYCMCGKSQLARGQRGYYCKGCGKDLHPDNYLPENGS